MTFDDIIQNKISPVLVNYTLWVLTEAHKLQLSTLYFFSQDSYLLKEIADILCQKFEIPIQIRYFYSSDSLLARATYHLFPKQDKRSLIFSSLDYDTPEKILLQIGLSPQDIEIILSGIQYQKNAPLTLKERKEFEHKCMNYPPFLQLVEFLSKKTFSFTNGYFMQEGLFHQETVAIVTLGWCPTMQQHFRKLLNHIGSTSILHGFYFGLLSSPPDSTNSFFHTYAVHPNSQIEEIASLNPLLLSCFLAAPHGNLLGYEEKDGIYYPILQEKTHSLRVDRHLALQREGVLSFVKTSMPNHWYTSFNLNTSLSFWKKDLEKELMLPSVLFLEYCKLYYLSDPFDEQKFIPLLQPISEEDVLQISPIKRLFIKNKKANPINYYWIFGSLKNSGFPIRFFLKKTILSWYRKNLKP